MSYNDPTQQVPPLPPNYPPQQGYPQQPQGYAQQGYPPPQGYPQSQPVPPQPYAPYGGPPQPYGGPPAGSMNAGSFWKALGTAGQICVIGGLVLFVSLFLTWFSAAPTCTGPDCTESGTNTGTITASDHSDDRTASGFGLIFGGTADLSLGQLTNSNPVTENFGFFPVILVLIASIALMALPSMVAGGKMAAKTGQLFILISAGAALLVEVIFLFASFGAFPKVKQSLDEFNSLVSALGVDAKVNYATGPAYGFWIALLATVAAGGAYLYFTYLKKPALVGAPAGVYAQPLQYPGAQPYGQQPYGQPPYPGSQPYGQPQYPGSQPYGQPPYQPGQPPYQPGQPPQYPNQPPPYPGQ